jgi:hypothetical protein
MAMKFWQGGSLRLSMARFAEAPRPLKMTLYVCVFLVTSGLLTVVALAVVGRAELVTIAEDTTLLFVVVIVPILAAFLLVWSLHRLAARAIERPRQDGSSKSPHGDSR